MSLLPMRRQNKPEAQPRDLDAEGPGFMERLEDQLRNPPPPNEFSDRREPRHFAPRATRVEEALMDGKEELEEKFTSTIDEVQKIVTDQVAAMREELDRLEAAVQESCGQAKLALTNSLNIAAQTLRASDDMKAKIRGFREIVQNNLPQNEFTRHGRDAGED